MRQVHYERPTDYQEPLEFETLSKMRNNGTSTAPLPSTQSQIDKVRTLKSTHSADSFASSKSKDFLNDYGEDAFESVNTTDTANGFSRPESRHMNSRTDELNKVNSMNGMFRTDPKQPVVDTYEEESWDEFEEGAINNKKVMNELEKDTATNKSIQIFKISRDVNVPVQGVGHKESKRKLEFDCTVSQNNALSIKANFQTNDNEHIELSMQLNLSGKHFDIVNIFIFILIIPFNVDNRIWIYTLLRQC